MKDINSPPEAPVRFDANPHGFSTRIPPPETVMLQKRIFELRRSGLSWEKIGEQVGRCSANVIKHYKKAIKSIYVEDVLHIRTLETERLNQLTVEVNRALTEFTPLVNRGEIVHDYLTDDKGNAILDEDGQRIYFKLQDQSVKLKAVDSALKIMERRAKLLGLDAPVKAEISGPDGGPIRTQNVNVTLTLEQLREEAEKRGLPSRVFEV